MANVSDVLELQTYADSRWKLWRPTVVDVSPTLPPPSKPGELDPSVTVVIFTASDKQMLNFDVHVGPCVPSAARKKALVSPLMQDGGELPAQTRALYTALTGQPDDTALSTIAAKGDGQLSVCSTEFVLAMHDANEEMLRLGDEDDARRDKDLTTFVNQQATLDQAWLAAANWPSSVLSTRNRLTRMGRASLALKKDQPLYCWHGPSVPSHVLRMGQGPYPDR